MAFRFKVIGSLVLLVAAFAVGASGQARADTLDKVRKRGHVVCGVSQGLAGFSNPDKAGNWTGLDIDFCRAVAVAVFGKASAVKFRPLTSKERFPSLQSGDVDVLSRNTTWTMGRDTASGIRFVGTIYYDGQAFMVRKALGVTSARELTGASVCTNAGTTTEANIADFFRSRKMRYEIVTFEKTDEVLKAYEAKRCDVYSSDASGLAAQRLRLAAPEQHMILPEIISKEPLGPVVRQGDERWFSIVRWTLFALINGEELGLTSQNVESMRATPNPEIRRFLGLEGSFGKRVGLAADWAAQIVRQVGNYGEIFERHLGSQSPLKITRGLNRLWNKGGIMYAPPIR
ncbi:MAG: amino acid ABC transporter substrate-binding protein [Hyphomicrobiaceae bacterium]